MVQRNSINRSNGKYNSSENSILVIKIKTTTLQSSLSLHTQNTSEHYNKMLRKIFTLQIRKCNTNSKYTKIMLHYIQNKTKFYNKFCTKYLILNTVIYVCVCV